MGLNYVYVESVTPESSLFLWAREIRRQDGPSASKRIADNIAKSMCVGCLAGDLHSECGATGIKSARSAGIDFFSPIYVFSYLQILTPNTLARILVECNEQYWVRNVPCLFPDEDYDIVTQRLTEICPEHPQLQYIGDYNNESGYHYASI